MTRIFLPAPESRARHRRQRMAWTTLLAACCLVAFAPSAWVWWLVPPLWLFRLVQSARSGPRNAWVVTNQRCFRLSLTEVGTQVREVNGIPDDADLSEKDLNALRSCFAELEHRFLVSHRLRQAQASRVARDLPRSLHDTLTRRLAAGETLVWADRPAPRDYFLYAPLDWWCMAAYFVAFPLAALAAVSSSPLLFCLAALGTGGAATVRLWFQIRGTVYAVTDRRGLVLSGRRCTQFDLADMRRFQRSQNAAGRGTLAPQHGAVLGEGFFGVRNVKVVDDLIRQRTTRGTATEVMPAEPPTGRGNEGSPLP